MEVDWNAYEIAVRKLEDQGLSTSDAQAVVDAEMLQNPKLNTKAVEKDATNE